MEPHRRRPSPETLAWVARSVSPRARVVGWRRLTGGSPPAAVHRVTVAVDGDRRHLVLRQWMPGGGDGDWRLWATEAVVAEGSVLDGLAASDVPAPRLVATTDGAGAGGLPALLMTREPGALQLAPRDAERWATDMAVTLARIHAVPMAAAPWRSWVDFGSLSPPQWTSRPQVWTEAVQAARRAAVDRPCFVHGDYQHFNILWRGNRLTSVVDWVHASTGPPDHDVGHCRLNLAVLFSAELAEQFRRAYESEAGRSVDPRWDLAALLSFDERWHDGIPRQVAGRTSVDHAGMNGRVENLLAAAVARL